MPTARVQVAIHTDDANPANYSTNTWYINHADLTGLANGVDAITTFYDDVDGWFGSQVAQNGHTIKCYNMADPEPRAPILEVTFDLAANPTQTPLPPEVAMCVSFQADRASGEPQSRRRGRVFIGPLGTGGVGSDGRPSTALLTAYETAAQNLLDASNAATDWVWCIYSTVNDDISFVTNGWIDNSYDTQRSRGLEYTARNLYS